MPLSFGNYINETATARLNSALPISAPKSITFRSKVTIERSAVFIPEQEFFIRWTNNEIRIENSPTRAWPKIIINLLADSLGIINRVKDINVFPSENTAEAEVKYTRFNWAMAHHPSFSITLPGIEAINFRFENFSEEEVRDLRNRAKLFRKLSYIENFFKISNSLSPYILAAEVRNIDYIYRGLTEGEFVVRGDGLNLAVPEKQIDWSVAPFNELGSFPQSSKWYSEFFGDTVYLFGRKLDIETVSIRLERAIYSGHSNVPLPNHSIQQARDIRFEVLDHQIYFRFDKYADKGKKKLQEKLAQFKYKFLRDDPKELLELMDEPLIPDVNAEEANLIAMGWLQYNHLPDRYCSQEPVFDEANKSWRVPIYIVYATGEGGEVGELALDLKTGKVISQTPIDTIRAKGKILAEKIIHARETTPVFAGD